MDKRKRKVLVVTAFLLVVLAIYDMSYNYYKYDFIQAGEGYIKVKKEFLNTADLSDDKGYCFLENDSCMMLGVDLPDAEVDDEILAKLDMSNEQIARLISAKSKKELKDIFDLNENEIIYFGKTDRVSFQLYNFQFESEGFIKQVTICREEDRSLVQIIKLEKGYFSWKELHEMSGGLQY